MTALTSHDTTQDGLRRSVVFPTIFPTTRPPASRRFADHIEASGPKDAEFRDRSASHGCPIATLRGPIL